MITMHSWMFLSRYEELRRNMLNMTFINLAHLGARAFEEIGGEVVQTVAFIIQKEYLESYIGKYERLVELNNAQEKEENFTSAQYQYTCVQKVFQFMVDHIIAYWISKQMQKHFENTPLLGDSADCRQGIATGDNDKFLRLWTEVQSSKINYCAQSQEEMENSGLLYAPYNKGGSFRRWYGNRDYVITIDKRHYEMLLNMGNHLPSRQRYYNPGLTWNDVSTSLYCSRYVEPGFVFDAAGPTCFYSGNMKYLIGLLNTKVTQSFLNVICQGLHYSTGHIPNIPFICDNEDEVSRLADYNIILSKNDWDSFENSWDFTCHPLTKGTTRGSLISDKYKEWEEECNTRFRQLKSNEEELNRIFIGIYGMQDELSPEVDDKDVTVRKAELQRDIRSLISYAVGCMFGRFSLDVEGVVYAGEDWDASNYTSFTPDADNIIPITDEEYLEDDIVTRLCEWLKVVYGADTLEDNLDFIAKALGNKGDSSRAVIRNYFETDFFKDHCQTYSVAGSGKRPIYWLFDSGKQNGFKALVYLHRYNADTIGNLRVEYLHKMQRVYESEIGRMQDMIDHSTNSREVATATKRKEKLTKQLKECRDYDEKIGHLALERIELDLDDGVKYNYRKVQTGSDGKFYEVLADSKTIMMDLKKYSDFKK